MYYHCHFSVPSFPNEKVWCVLGMARNRRNKNGGRSIVVLNMAGSKLQFQFSFDISSSFVRGFPH
jgi:hypothetical protein